MPWWKEHEDTLDGWRGFCEQFDLLQYTAIRIAWILKIAKKNWIHPIQQPGLLL